MRFFSFIGETYPEYLLLAPFVFFLGNNYFFTDYLYPAFFGDAEKGLSLFLSIRF